MLEEKRQRAEEIFPDNLSWCPIAQGVEKIKYLRVDMGITLAQVNNTRQRLGVLQAAGQSGNPEWRQLKVDEQVSTWRYYDALKNMVLAEEELAPMLPLMDQNQNDDNSGSSRDNNNTTTAQPDSTT